MNQVTEKNGLRMVLLRLPYPPTVNHYWRHTGRVTYVTAKGKSFRKNVLAIVQNELGQIKPLSGRLAISIEAIMPDRRSRDIDNITKATLDALEAAGVYNNDHQIDRLMIERLTADPPGAVDVIVQEIRGAKKGGT